MANHANFGGRSLLFVLDCFKTTTCHPNSLPNRLFLFVSVSLFTNTTLDGLKHAETPSTNILTNCHQISRPKKWLVADLVGFYFPSPYTYLADYM